MIFLVPFEAKVFFFKKLSPRTLFGNGMPSRFEFFEEKLKPRTQRSALYFLFSPLIFGLLIYDAERH